MEPARPVVEGRAYLRGIGIACARTVLFLAIVIAGFYLQAATVRAVEPPVYCPHFVGKTDDQGRLVGVQLSQKPTDRFPNWEASFLGFLPKPRWSGAALLGYLPALGVVVLTILVLTRPITSPARMSEAGAIALGGFAGVLVIATTFGGYSC
jgi:hypothetical protein